MKITAIINRNKKFGTQNNILVRNDQIMRLINKHLKAGTAKKLVDTKDTLMYELG